MARYFKDPNGNPVEVHNHTNGGIGFVGLLTIVFIILKLTGHITWSWWWVLSPLWIPWVTLLLVFILAFLFHIIFSRR